MRLKEIKPGMVIHCKTQEEKKALLEEAEKLGYLWYGGKQKPTEKMIEDIGNTIHFYDAGKSCLAQDYKHITHSERIGENMTEFSDLILPELTAEEVLEICHEICRGKSCNECLMSGNCFIGDEPDFTKVIEICEQWKSDHEKKEPEIETVDICLIIEVQPDGRKRCVHEIDLNPYGEMLFKEQIEEILKRYCMEHEGEFIAAHEVVSRVKAVE